MRSIEVPEEVYKLISAIARRKAKSVERLHANYYSFLTKVNFEAHREDALKLIQNSEAFNDQFDTSSSVQRG